MKFERKAIIEQLQKSMQRLQGRRVEVESVSEDSRLGEDLGLDSLDLLEIRFDIEDKWNIELEDDEAAAMVTVRDVVDKVKMKTELSGEG